MKDDEKYYLVTRKDMDIIRRTCYHPYWDGGCGGLNKCEYFVEPDCRCEFNVNDFIKDIVTRGSMEYLLDGLMDIFLHTRVTNSYGGRETKGVWTREELIDLMNVFKSGNEKDVIPEKPIFPPDTLNYKEYLEHL